MRPHRIETTCTDREHAAIVRAAGDTPLAEWVRVELCRAAGVRVEPLRRGFAADRSRARKASADGVRARRKKAREVTRG